MIKTLPISTFPPLPKDWDQLSQTQFKDIATILHSSKDWFEGEIKLLWILSNLKPRQFCQFEPEELAPLLEEIEWLKELYIHKSFFPKIKKRFKKFHGPENIFQNFTFDQFSLTEEYYLQFLDSQNITDLDAMISCMYLNKRFLVKDFKFAPLFNIDTYEHHLKRFANIHPNLKSAIFINYTGMRNYFQSMFPACFTKGKGSKASFTVLHHADVLKDDLAGNKFGSITEVGNQKVHVLFTHLQNIEEKRYQAEQPAYE
jgi:hypothetical protein